MTIDEVDWILRYPSDELVMHPDMLTKINGAIAATKCLAVAVKYHDSYGPTGRLERKADTLADRKLTLDQTAGPRSIAILVKGETKALVYFREE